VAAGLEDLLGSLEIDAHALVEVLLGLAADDGRQMKHGAGFRVDQLVRCVGFAEVAVAGLQTLVLGKGLRRRADVGDQNLVDFPFLAVGSRDAAAFEQRVDEPRSEKTRATGHQYLHGTFSSGRVSKSRAHRSSRRRRRW
jgi:hypothetical protein